MDGLLFHLMIGLATWRLTTLFVSERGPFQIFQFIRWVAGENRIKYDEQSNKIYPNEIIRMLECSMCTSVWVGYGFALAQYKTLTPLEIFIFGLAYSGFSVYFDKQIRRMR